MLNQGRITIRLGISVINILRTGKYERKTSDVTWLLMDMQA